MADHSHIGFVIIVKDMTTTKYTMREIRMQRIDKVTFINWFYDIHFLRTGFNKGMMFEIEYECPDLTEMDIQREMAKVVKNLRNTFNLEENPSRRL